MSAINWNLDGATLRLASHVLTSVPTSTFRAKRGRGTEWPRPAALGRVAHGCCIGAISTTRRNGGFVIRRLVYVVREYTDAQEEPTDKYTLYLNYNKHDAVDARFTAYRSRYHHIPTWTQ